MKRGELTFEVIPVATVTVGDTPKPETVPVNNDYLLSDAEITVRLSVPEGLDVQEIKHTSDTRGVEYFFETGKNTFEKQDAHVVLTIHHFSELKLSGTVTAAAMVDGLAYSTHPAGH